MVDSESMVGWITVREITDVLAQPAQMIRCEGIVFTLTVPSRKVLNPLAWKLVDEGFSLVVKTTGQVIAQRGRITVNIEARSEDEK